MQWAEQLREEYSKIAKETMSKGGQSCPTLENIETVGVNRIVLFTMYGREENLIPKTLNTNG